jgi:hypothetical protein
VAVFSAIVLACAVCGAAEQTLPTNGAEIPFEGRKRAMLDARAASFATTDRALRVVELRAEPGVAMAVLPTTIVSAEVPILRRSLELDESKAAVALPTSAPRNAETHSMSSSAMTLGDVELRASHTAWRSEPASITRRLTVSAGMKLPTAPLERDPSGQLVHPDLQPGCGSIAPMLGVAHSWRASLWSLSTGVSVLFPVAVREGAHPGDSLRASTTLQLQPTRILATRLGVNGRLDGTGELDGEVVRRSGGAAVYLAPEVVVMPTQDVVLAAGASFPVVQEMRGYRATAPVLLASVGVDF